MAWGAAIAAGGALLGGQLAQNAQQSKEFRGQLRTQQFEREDTRYQRAVKDAKAAGLHPLFALGTSGGFSGGTAFSGQAPSGSHLGRGVAAAAKYAGKGVDTHLAKGRQQQIAGMDDELHGLRVRKMEAEIALDELAIASKQKMGEQTPMWGDGDPGLSMGDPSTKTYPYGTKKGPPLEVRPTTAYGKTSRPMQSEVIAADGYRYNIIDPDTGDEISQADLVAQIILRHTRSARKAPGREMRIQANRLASLLKKKYGRARTSRARRGKMRSQLRAQSRYGR